MTAPEQDHSGAQADPQTPPEQIVKAIAEEAWRWVGLRANVRQVAAACRAAARRLESQHRASH